MARRDDNGYCTSSRMWEWTGMGFGDLDLDSVPGGGGGRVHGLAVAIVTDNADPEGLARVRVKLAGQEARSFWARMAVPMAGRNRGTYFLPEIGDEVLVGAENGDPGRLYVLGMLWNGQAEPPETNQDGKNNRRLIRTRSGHELMFVDDEAAPLAELKLKDGKKLSLSNDGVQITDGTSKIVIETNSSAITIESTAGLKIKSNEIAIEAGASMELKSSGTLTIEGALVQIN